MIKAKSSDKKLVCELLMSSFADNPSVNFIISGNLRRKARLAALMNYSFDQCMRFGEVWLSDDKEGCALLLFPQKKRTSIVTFFLDLKFIVCTVGLRQLPKVLRRERLLDLKRPKHDMAYLWFIGVERGSQHNGVGSRLLSQVLAQCQLLDLPVLLETSVPGNLPWYGSFGFRIYDELDLGYRLYFLAKSN